MPERQGIGATLRLLKRGFLGIPKFLGYPLSFSLLLLSFLPASSLLSSPLLPSPPSLSSLLFTFLQGYFFFIQGLTTLHMCPVFLQESLQAGFLASVLV